MFRVEGEKTARCRLLRLALEEKTKACVYIRLQVRAEGIVLFVSGI